MLLTIGYHQLEGKRMELKKPFAVLDRVAGSGSDEEDQSGTQYKVRQLPKVHAAAAATLRRHGPEHMPHKGATVSHWPHVFCPVPQVIGVVREKILFKARPRALITKPGGQK